MKILIFTIIFLVCSGGVFAQEADTIQPIILMPIVETTELIVKPIIEIKYKCPNGCKDAKFTMDISTIYSFNAVYIIPTRPIYNENGNITNQKELDDYHNRINRIKIGYVCNKCGGRFTESKLKETAKEYNDNNIFIRDSLYLNYLLRNK